MSPKVVTLFPSFAHKGGAEDMAISIAKGLSAPNEQPVVLSQDPIVGEIYKESGCNFEKFNIANIKKYHKEGAVFLSHHRKLTTYLLLISRLLFFNKLRVLHVAHNTFSNLKYTTLYPSQNIAVSQSVKDNMVSYFGVPENRIKVIYNGLEDQMTPDKAFQRINNDSVNVLFLGRIDPVKRQVEFVNQTKGKLSPNIKIYFGGEGKDFEQLKATIGDNHQYIPLGLIDVYKELGKFDYVCLFSEKEGLPLSLIQGCMFGKPLITNDIPQSLEVNEDKVTGWVGHSWEEITKLLNNLPAPDSEEYRHYSANARRVFETKFSYDIMVGEYEKIIT